MKRLCLSLVTITLLAFTGYSGNDAIIDSLKKIYKDVIVCDSPINYIRTKDKKGDDGHIFLPDGTLIASLNYGHAIINDTVHFGEQTYYLVGLSPYRIFNAQGKEIASYIRKPGSSNGDKGNILNFYSIHGHEFFTVIHSTGSGIGANYYYGGTEVITTEGNMLFRASNHYVEIIDAPDELFFYLTSKDQYGYDKIVNADGKEMIHGKPIYHNVIGEKSYFISFAGHPDNTDMKCRFVFDSKGRQLPDVLKDVNSYIELDGHAFFILQKMEKGFGGKLTMGDCYVYSPDFDIHLPWTDNDKNLAVKTEEGRQVLVKTGADGMEIRQYLDKSVGESVTVNQKPTERVAPKTAVALASDIDKDIPWGKTNRPNTFALIIANENYRRVSTVPFAVNDGIILSKYLHTTLGLPEKNIMTVTDASLNDIAYNLERLKDICEAYEGDASVIVYYAGHGVPDEATRDAYLLPTDGYAESAAKSGFSLNQFLSAVEAMPTRRSTVFIDACFSGASRDGNMLSSVRGVKIKPKDNAVNGNLVVFSASQGDETAQPYKEQNHGLFTYFLLKKIKESAGEVTLGELAEYISTQVRRISAVNGHRQTPTVRTATTNTSWSTFGL